MIMKQSMKDKAAGKAQEMKGKIKEKVGQMTNDPDLEDEGTADKIVGKVRNVVGKIEDVAGE